MFENKIAYWADVKGMKHKALAKQCGVSPQTFSNWVRNITQPDLEHAERLARIFGITIDDLVKREEED
ncbi:helix-turn-helix transcriptional regulator [Bacillus sp. JJ1474]|uniref:helix-turn-helix transcriptional regulator n=1 Tax=Bacillus sp. JJ1474 TaxID=3122955 RepID=UPI002FFEE483